MENKLADRSANIFIIDPDELIRTGIQLVLKDLGFNNIRKFKNIQEALNFFATDNSNIHWIISSLFEGQKYNGIHLLDMGLKHPSFIKTRVSLLLEDKDKFCIPEAFKMGLLSYHSRLFNEAGMRKELSKLFNILTTHEFDSCLTSFEFLYQYLKREKRFTEAHDISNLFRLKYHNNYHIDHKVAESQFLIQNPQNAIQLIKKMKDQYPDKKEDTEKLLAKFHNKDPDKVVEDDDAMERTFAERYDINTCVVIDPDVSTHTIMKRALSDLGVSFVKMFSDGEDAWKWLSESKNPDLIIQEWKIPKVSGSALAQRVRNTGLGSIPIIIFSSIVEKSDKILLKEIGISDFIMKPKSQEDLMKSIKAMVQREHHPDNFETAQRVIHQEINAGNASLIKDKIDEFMKNEKVPKLNKLLIQAEYLCKQTKYVEAKSVAIEALQKYGDSLALTNLLGKILLKLQEYELAKKFLTKAQKVSPNRLDRLCSIAEACTELGENYEAEEKMNTAKNIDKENRAVVETLANISISRGDTDEAQKHLSHLSSLKHLIAGLNNKAVRLASKNKIDESIHLYEKALRAIPQSEEKLKDMINYNIALGHAKKGEMENCAKRLKLAINSKNEGLQKKVKSLYERIQKSIDTGQKIKLNLNSIQTETPNITPAHHGTRKLPISEQAKAGDICCHKIYLHKDNDPISDRFWALLSVAKPEKSNARGRKTLKKAG